MDLGQFERFRRGEWPRKNRMGPNSERRATGQVLMPARTPGSPVMITKPYDIMVNHERREVLSAVRIGNGQYHSRISFLGRSGSLIFHFAMSRTTLGKFETWMVDSVLPAPDGESNQSV